MATIAQGISPHSLNAPMPSKREDWKKALDAYKQISRGGMRSFADWMPPVAFADEIQDYVLAVFVALMFYVVLRMNQLKEKLDTER